MSAIVSSKLNAQTLQDAWEEGEANIDKVTFLKRCRHTVGNDERWYSRERSKMHQVLLRVGDAADDVDAVDVTELCMWLDGTPLHRAPMDECDLGGFRSVSGGPSQLIISGKSPDKHVHRPNRSTPSAAKRWMKGLDLDDLVHSYRPTFLLNDEWSRGFAATFTKPP